MLVPQLLSTPLLYVAQEVASTHTETGPLWMAFSSYGQVLMSVTPEILKGFVQFLHVPTTPL
jgi:hypothetical protein